MTICQTDLKLETSMPYLHIAGYKFVTLATDFLVSVQADLKQKAIMRQLKGTILLSAEGINLFLAGTPEAIHIFICDLKKIPEFADLWLKISESDFLPFKRLILRIKKEIISMHQSHIKPEQKTAPYLDPMQLKQWFDEHKEMILLDTRNEYEVHTGSFKEAIHLNINQFSEFPIRLKKLPESFKEKPIVTFCTGGIRCEKAAAYMLEQGFKHVWQLKGGILNYFEVCKDDYFEGNCFVFDDRMTVNPRDGG